MKCERCEEDFSPDEEPGGLLFGVPQKFIWAPDPHAPKIHLCAPCTTEVIVEIRNHRARTAGSDPERGSR